MFFFFSFCGGGGRVVLASEPVGGRSRATELPCFPLWYRCMLCDEVLLPWYFRSPGFDVRPPPPPGPPKYDFFFFHILGLNLNISYQIASLFDMYIDMGERLAGKQDRPSLIIEHALRAPQIAQNIHIFLHFGSYMKNWFSNCSPFVVYIFFDWWGLHLLTFRFPCWIVCKGPTWPCKLLLKRG